MKCGPFQDLYLGLPCDDLLLDAPLKRSGISSLEQEFSEPEASRAPMPVCDREGSKSQLIPHTCLCILGNYLFAMFYPMEGIPLGTG